MKLNPRKELKLELLDTRRVKGKDGEIHACEGQAFTRHVCSGGLHMNEVFYTRGHVMKMPAKDKQYINHEINCSILCGSFHTNWGHSRKFREWYEYIQRGRYGNHAVDTYLAEFPTKLA